MFVLFSTISYSFAGIYCKGKGMHTLHNDIANSAKIISIKILLQYWLVKHSA